MYISDISKNRKETRRSASESNKNLAVNNSAADRSENDSASISSRSNKDAMKIAGNYAIMAAICLVIGIVYEIFSHDVLSVFMVGAFAIPLVLGTLPNLYIGLRSLKTPCYAAENVYACGIVTLTIGTMLKGVLDIFGTTNSLLKFYFIIGAAFAILGIVFYLLQNHERRETLPISVEEY